jgi:hypothetical protein
VKFFSRFNENSKRIDPRTPGAKNLKKTTHRHFTIKYLKLEMKKNSQKQPQKSYIA